MGAGKTVCALTAASELLCDGVCSRILVVAPLKVCNKVWRQEHLKWSHLEHLNVGIATGSEANRKAAIESDAEIVVINFENLKWLFKHYKKNNFDGLIVDELSKLKASGGSNFKALRPQRKKMKWAVGMTGTPVSENWLGLYGQMLIVDGGAALGTRKDKYLGQYFYPTDYNQYNWELRDGSAEQIADVIRDVVHVMPDYRGELKPKEHIRITVALPETVRDIYNTLRDDFCIDEIEAPNAAVLTGKLQQVAAGFLYREDQPALELHTAKLEALAAWVGKEPLMVCYWFKHELAALQAQYPEAMTLDEKGAVEEWNAGRLNMLLVHPRSGGHGLNLAPGGALIVWLSPTWSRDLFEQTNARLWRRGQTKVVRVVELLCFDTVDDVVAARVESKADYHTLLLEHFTAGV
jgi:hypothetical protein